MQNCLKLLTNKDRSDIIACNAAGYTGSSYNCRKLNGGIYAPMKGDAYMVKTYSRIKDGSTQIAANFLIYEFACNDGTDSILLDDNLPRVLQRIREVAGNRPVTISSAYRTPEYNKQTGGAPNSYHLHGKAADIVVANTKPLDVCRCAETAMAELRIPGGICLYTRQAFVHVDVRTEKWRGQNDGDGEQTVTGWTPMPVPDEQKQQDSKDTGNDRIIWDFLKSKGLNDYAVAGFMGNMYAESAFLPNNLQNSYEKSLGHTDASYTAAVDDGKYPREKFTKDWAGYGLVQWTHPDRKGKLYDFIRNRGVSIGDIHAQLDFLWDELQGYTAVMKVLKEATSVRQASDVVLTRYEQPADQGVTEQERRAGYGQAQYKKFADKQEPETLIYTVIIIDGPLNIRGGPGTNFNGVGKLMVGEKQIIVEEASGEGAKLWGRLQGDAGWIALDFTEKLK